MEPKEQTLWVIGTVVWMIVVHPLRMQKEINTFTIMNRIVALPQREGNQRRHHLQRIAQLWTCTNSLYIRSMMLRFVSFITLIYINFTSFLLDRWYDQVSTINSIGGESLPRVKPDYPGYLLFTSPMNLNDAHYILISKPGESCIHLSRASNGFASIWA